MLKTCVDHIPRKRHTRVTRRLRVARAMMLQRHSRVHADCAIQDLAKC